MPNGVTVSDWLGTAMTAAGCAAALLEDVREGKSPLGEYMLRQAADDAAQALQEVCAVMDRYGYAHGYDAACSFGAAS